MRILIFKVRYFVLFCVLSLAILQSQAQSISTGNGKFEVGLGLGPSFFVGDLGGIQGVGKPFVKDVNFPFTKFMKGIYANMYPAEWLGFRAAINFGKLEGDDFIIDNKGGAERFRKQRNLQFKSNLFEAYVAAEFYPTVFFEKYDGLAHKFRPYGLIGFGYFHYNPKGEYIAPNGTSSWVELQPLRLEGQGMAEYPNRKPYSLWQPEVPMGFGFKYYLKETMYVGLEVLHRLTFTDYLDDVSKTYINPNLFDVYLTPSQAVIAKQLHYREKMLNPSINRPIVNTQRGDPTENDAFFSAILRFGWRLNDSNSPNGRAKRQLKCPVFY